VTSKSVHHVHMERGWMFTNNWVKLKFSTYRDLIILIYIAHVRPLQLDVKEYNPGKRNCFQQYVLKHTNIKRNHILIFQRENRILNAQPLSEGICTLSRKMTSFRKHYCALQWGSELGLVEIQYVFSQTCFRASVVGPLASRKKRSMNIRFKQLPVCSWDAHCSVFTINVLKITTIILDSSACQWDLRSCAYLNLARRTHPPERRVDGDRTGI